MNIDSKRILFDSSSIKGDRISVKYFVAEFWGIFASGNQKGLQFVCDNITEPPFKSYMITRYYLFAAAKSIIKSSWARIIERLLLLNYQKGVSELVQYFISFLEGVITFISPCLLPMLPIYISYFAGGGERSSKKTVTCALGFVLGFTILFVAMGALAGTVGSFLKEHQTAVNIISGLIVILFGLNFLDVLKINLFHGSQKNINTSNMNFFSAMLFGMIFSIGWTPCVGAFLGSALVMASQQGHVLDGMLMLLVYSLGLGIPFVVSAILIDRLKSTFDWVKRHYDIINRISGAFLIFVGILMATGMLGWLLSLLS